MRKIYKLNFTVFIFSFLSLSLNAQNLFFADAGENKTLNTTGQRVIVPQKFRTSSLNVQAMKDFLWSLPEEKTVFNTRQSPVISIPMPDGTTARFNVWESSIQEPGLAAKFPDIKTFLGQGIDDRYATIRMDFGPNGFHAQVLSANGSYYIDPYARGDVNNYISYFRTDLQKAGTWLCEVPDNPVSYRGPVTEAACLGTSLRTYRLAVACTGEYAQAPGIAAGSNPAVLHNAIVTTVNRVVGVYENEVSVRMVLVANNNLIEFLNAGTDPFNGNNNANVLINESQTVIDANVGHDNYDIGHTFSTGGGGLAQLSSVCGPSKARGITGSPFPTGDAYDIDYVSHEMGHQFGGNHSMAGCGSSPATTKYEVGSGTSIQAYAGICGSENIQPNSDPYFHAISFDEISNFVNGGGSCAVETATNNTLPIIDPLPNNGVTIPISTPFTLSGTASDADGDALTYSWEQWDRQGTQTWNAGATAAAGNTVPLFKSRVPKTNGIRTFPDIAVILANYPANPAATMGGLKGETLSPVSRAMNFRLTVRDNRAGGGGVSSSGGGGCQTSTAFTINVAGTAPFVVTSPNGGESYPGGTTQTVTWNVVGTDAAPFNVSNVRILFSTDGGQTFPQVLLASTANDGSADVSIPVGLTSTARIKVEALGNIFFDISNANFNVTAPVNGFTFNSPAAVVASCPAPNVMTSGNLTATYIGTFTGDINLTGVVNPAGPAVSFSNSVLTTGSPSTTVSLTGMATLSPGNYTVTVTGTGVGGSNPVSTRDIVFTINAGSGPSVTTQPVSQSACVGQNAVFNVVATGVTGYQWQVSTTGCAGTFTNISGATSASYTVTGATTAQNGYAYRCVLTGQCGTTNSFCASLTVNTVPDITAQPSDISVCSESDASFTVAATGTGLSYQWELSTDGGATWNPIGGATAATYTITSTTVSQNGYRYRCVVSGTCAPEATSNAAVLTVNSSVTVTGNPSNSTICEGTGTSFTAAASGTGLNYQWQISTDGGTTWADVSNSAVYSGAGTSTLTLANVPPSLNGNRYRCNITSPPCTPGITSSALLTVNTFPVITSQPSPLAVCEGGSPSFSVTATTGVGTLSYQWQVSTNGGTSYANIPGATSATFSSALITAGANGYLYRVIVTAGCGSVTSNAVALTVNTYPVISLSAVPTVICQSDPALTITGSPAGGSFAGPGISGSTFTPSVAGVGSASVTYTATNQGCTSQQTRVISVNECAERHLRLGQYPAVFIYPNPTDGRVNIRINTDLYTSVGVRVFNAAGQEVHGQLFNGIAYGSVLNFDLSKQQAGLYHVVVYSGNDSKGSSIIVYR